MRTIGIWVAGLLVVIGTGVGVEAGSPVRSYSARSALAAPLDQIAVNAAAGSGDRHVTSVTWVRASSRAAAVSYVMGDGVEGTKPVYVLEMRGSFVYNGPQGMLPGPQPSNATTPAASVLTLVMVASNLLVTDFGLSDRWVPLASLGTPETDSLVGLSPN